METSEARRRRYQNDPEFRARKLAISRKWQATNPRDRSEYLRQWRAKNRKHVHAYDHDRYWGDGLYRAQKMAYGTEYNEKYRAFARAARENLRSLMALGPRTTRLIKRYIDIESASDAEVRRFYRKWMKELKHGNR